MDGSYPLTPTLSRWERVNHFPVIVAANNPGSSHGFEGKAASIGWRMETNAVGTAHHQIDRSSGAGGDEFEEAGEMFIQLGGAE